MPDLNPDRDGPSRNGRRAVRVRVEGRVQGVFFRASTQEQARGRGVDGWVRNDPDGAVTAVLEGDDDQVEAVLDWIRAGGPRRASVHEVTVEDVEPEGHYGFAVRH